LGSKLIESSTIVLSLKKNYATPYHKKKPMQLLIQSSDFVNINFYILAEQKYTLDMDNSNCSDFVTINFYIMAEQKYTSDMDNSNC